MWIVFFFLKQLDKYSKENCCIFWIRIGDHDDWGFKWFLSALSDATGQWIVHWLWTWWEFRVQRHHQNGLQHRCKFKAVLSFANYLHYIGHHMFKFQLFSSIRSMLSMNFQRMSVWCAVMFWCTTRFIIIGLWKRRKVWLEFNESKTSYAIWERRKPTRRARKRTRRRAKNNHCPIHLSSMLKCLKSNRFVSWILFFSPSWKSEKSNLLNFLVIRFHSRSESVPSWWSSWWLCNGSVSRGIWFRYKWFIIKHRSESTAVLCKSHRFWAKSMVASSSQSTNGQHEWMELSSAWNILRWKCQCRQSIGNLPANIERIDWFRHQEHQAIAIIISDGKNILR